MESEYDFFSYLETTNQFSGYDNDPDWLTRAFEQDSWPNQPESAAPVAPSQPPVPLSAPESASQLSTGQPAHPHSGLPQMVPGSQLGEPMAPLSPPESGPSTPREASPVPGDQDYDLWHEEELPRSQSPSLAPESVIARSTGPLALPHSGRLQIGPGSQLGEPVAPLSMPESGLPTPQADPMELNHDLLESIIFGPSPSADQPELSVDTNPPQPQLAVSAPESAIARSTGPLALPRPGLTTVLPSRPAPQQPPTVQPAGPVAQAAPTAPVAKKRVNRGMKKAKPGQVPLGWCVRQHASKCVDHSKLPEEQKCREECELKVHWFDEWQKKERDVRNRKVDDGNGGTRMVRANALYVPYLRRNAGRRR